METQSNYLSREDYVRAERFLPWNLEKLVSYGAIKPVWIEETEQFWYLRKGGDGKQFILVDPEQKSREPAFDHSRLASSLSTTSGKACTADLLPFESIEFINKDRISFTAGDKNWECDLNSYEIKEGKAKPPQSHTEAISPDKKWAAYVKNFNVYVRNIENGEVIQLTKDGKQYFDYGGSPESNTVTILFRQRGFPVPPIVLWSPDSKKLITTRLDQRKVKDLHLLQYVPKEGNRPILHSYRYAMVGDTNLTQGELVILNVETKEQINTDLPMHDIEFMGPIELKEAFWGEDSQKAYYLQRSRDHKGITFHEINAATGKTRCLIEEKGQTYVEFTPMLGTNPNVRVSKDGGAFIWFSERDGWGHLYRYDAKTGNLINQITCGKFLVFNICHMDEEGGWIYFHATGREAGRDPYLKHLYRAKLDGSQIQLLTPENADHSVSFSKSGKYFVDTFSRIDLPPTIILRAVDGTLIHNLEEADITLLKERGWHEPEPFVVKARDGATDVWGVIYRPSNFDPKLSYPVIDSIYPGPQIYRSRKFFLPMDSDLALAELGFIVVTIDGLGNCGRSKANHDFSYGKMEDGGGLIDHILGLQQLADRYPYMDLNRVGIYGHSGGGFASTKAILTYPDFYKVAVSSSGNHDQRGYLAGWGELYQGLLDGNNYDAQSNIALAGNLKGHLFLVHGDMDDNVHPALTMQVVDALIKAGKDFDMLILPNRDHAFGSDPYFIRRKWDYFVKHLAGKEPPKEYAINAADIPPLNPF